MAEAICPEAHREVGAKPGLIPKTPLEQWHSLYKAEFQHIPTQGPARQTSSMQASLPAPQP